MQKRLLQNVKLQVARRGLLRVACSSQKQAADHQNSALWSRRQTMVATGSCLLGASACNLLPQQFAQAAGDLEADMQADAGSGMLLSC